MSAPGGSGLLAYSIPRAALMWLLGGVLLVILPHLPRMPLWLGGVLLACLGLRVLIWQGRVSFPGRRLKAGLVLLMLVLVALQFGRDILSTDATVAMLLAGIAMKLLEMQRKRDVLLVLYLCYFTIIAQFIYSQSILVALYMLVAVVVISTALVSLGMGVHRQQPLRALRLSVTLLAQALPLMLVCFLLFPRIPPLWAVPLSTATAARSGLSDSMAPGDIGTLARSAELAFRVRFADAPPDYRELYWRALTLDEFDGRSWRRAGPSGDSQSLAAQAGRRQDWFDAIGYVDRPLAYNVIMEPTNQNWIYTLQMPQLEDERMLLRSDYQVQSLRRISQRLSYDLRSWLDFRTDAGHERKLLQRALQLPDAGNPRSRALAEQLWSGVDSPQQYIERVLQRFREQEYRYTLEPPVLGADPVDAFLFDTQAGFCEHFAGAFTFMLRAAGIPARVVTGYMGGEFNPLDATLTVRQYDAHAWSEVWLPEQGWVRYDPTAAVAPERVELGSNSLLQGQQALLEGGVLDRVRFGDSRLLNQLRYRLEQLDFAWSRLVLNYDRERQFELFRRLFGALPSPLVTLVLSVAVLLPPGLLALVVLRRPAAARQDPATRSYRHFCRRLAAVGLERAPGETPVALLQRAQARYPHLQAELAAITELYMHLAYVAPQQDKARLQALRRLVQRFRPPV